MNGNDSQRVYQIRAESESEGIGVQLPRSGTAFSEIQVFLPKRKAKKSGESSSKELAQHWNANRLSPWPLEKTCERVLSANNRKL